LPIQRAGLPQRRRSGRSAAKGCSQQKRGTRQEIYFVSRWSGIPGRCVLRRISPQAFPRCAVETSACLESSTAASCLATDGEASSLPTPEQTSRTNSIWTANAITCEVFVWVVTRPVSHVRALKISLFLAWCAS